MYFERGCIIFIWIYLKNKILFQIDAFVSQLSKFFVLIVVNLKWFYFKIIVIVIPNEVS